MKKLNLLNKDELKKLKTDIDDELDGRDKIEWKKQTKTLAQLLKLYGGYGYIIPTTSKFWRIRSGVHRGCYGYQVGRYTHSCHVDTTDFIVLLVNSGEHRFIVDNFDDISLEGPMIVP